MIKILELFSGYGTASHALKQLGINYEIIGYSDIDKYANQCFRKNHYKETEKCENCGEFKDGVEYREDHSEFECGKCYDGEDKSKELGDATKIDPYELEDFDLLTAGFPCQAFSVAGKGLGELDTRGTLFNEIIRIAEVKKPKYMLLENVKGLLSKRHKVTFDKIISELNRIGYNVNWKVLNTKDHGIPQNRERVWFVCYKAGNLDYYDFEFPEKEELKLFLKDILEDKVDEKYYLSENQMNQLLLNIEEKGLWNTNPSGKGINGNVNIKNISDTLSTNKGEGSKIIQINKSKESHNQQPFMQNRVYDIRGISPSVCSVQPNFYLPIKNATKKGYLEGYPNDGVNLEHPNSKTRRGRIQKDVMGTLQTNDQRGVITYDFRIRKLTPKECFRLQGFLNDEVNLDGISNSQCYKLAGNGQSINVVKKIFYNMFVKNAKDGMEKKE